METLINLSQSTFKEKVLDTLDCMCNFSITEKENKEDDFWISEHGSHRRYVFKAFPNGEVQVFYRDMLTLTYNQNGSVSAPINADIDSLNFLLA